MSGVWGGAHLDSIKYLEEAAVLSVGVIPPLLVFKDPSAELCYKVRLIWLLRSIVTYILFPSKVEISVECA